MDQISLPSKIDYLSAADGRSGTLTIEPLYPGYGTTLGNALRRVLLSSLPGTAITAIKIHNAPHEFTTLPRVQEDILQIVLNLKQVRARIFSDEPIKLHLSAKGERVVTARDFEANSQVQIVNPELTIATLTAHNAELEIDVWLNQGRGYVPTEAREKEKMEIGTIAIDALYSPIRQVIFRVDPVRVGQMTNYDKLIMDISTDGTITAAAAVSHACKLVMEHFSLLTKYLDAHIEEQNNTPLPEEPKKKRARKVKVKDE